MTIKASTLGGGGALPRLAQNLTWPSDKELGSTPYLTITGIDASSGLTTALSLTGKWAIMTLGFSGLSTESYTFKLTIDGDIIWDDTFSVTQTTLNLLDNPTGSAGRKDLIAQCNSSFLLEVQSTSDTDIDLDYLARPIL